MNATTTAARAARRVLVLGALAGGLLAAAPGYGAAKAAAAYTVKLDAGTLKITQTAESDKLVLQLRPGSPETLELDAGADGTVDFSFDRNTFTAIDVKAGDGDDDVRINESFGAFSDELVTIRGEGGADTLRGGSGAETFFGGAGNDDVDGGRGEDRVLLGGGDDRFAWDPGDGSDTVEGQGGDDRLDFNGSAIGENIDISANGDGVRLNRNIANIQMDLDGVEWLAFHAFGGADNIVVNDLTGTNVKTVDADLNAAGGGGGDGQADTVTTIGTSGADRVTLTSPGGFATVSGLSAEVLVESAETANDDLNVATLGGNDTIATGREVFGPASINVDGGDGDDVTRYNGTSVADTIEVAANGSEVSTSAPLAARLDTSSIESLVVLGLAGPDTITAAGNLAPLTALTIDGGDDEDVLRGGNGADLLRGGNGNDDIDGNQGADHALLGRGDDRFAWDPGDGSDTVEGQGGDDRLDFNGSAIAENIDISANGDRVRLARNIANIQMDLDGVEWLAFHAFGGADNIVVNDLTGTNVKTVDADLNAAGGGGGDGQADTVTAIGTSGADRVTLTSPGGFATVSGLSAEVLVESAETANDDLNVATLGGNDTIATGREVFGPASINVDGGDGDDVTRYNGTSVADTIEVAANGSEVRTVAPLAARLDTSSVESLVVLGLAGTDTITAAGNLAPLTALTIDGGEDSDVLRGGNGADLLVGGNGNDDVDGGRGEDRVLLGGGGDRFAWDPGDGSDTVEGQGGDDRLDFNGSAIAENIDISANGDRVRLARNIANIQMDLDGVEGVNIRALGGSDTIVVNDLTGTNVKSVDVDLNAVGGGGDTQSDTVVTKGTNRRDAVQVNRSALQVQVAGLAAQTRIIGSEPANDTLRVQTLGGNDKVTVAPGVSDLITTVVELGAGE